MSRPCWCPSGNSSRMSQRQAATIARTSRRHSCEQNLIDVRIVRADLLGHVGNIELDGPTAARFEVDEQQAVLGAEEVAGMWFAVQQLLGSAAAVDPLTRVLQCAEEKMPVGLSECGGFVSVRDQPFEPLRLGP